MVRKSNATAFQFEGFESPTTTPVPDVVFDRLLAKLGEAELKALLYIIRRTFGFKKDRDQVSFNQFLRGITTKDGQVLDEGCGIRDRTTLSKALKSLEQKRIIKSEKGRDEHGENVTTIYSLRFRGDPPGTVGNTQQGVVGNSYHRSMNNPPLVVGNSHPQQTVLQQTVIQHTVNGVVKGGERTGIEKLKSLNQPKEKTEYIAQYILEELGDKKSEKFYKLVATKIPEQVIRQALAEIKADGAKSPAKLFTYKMKQYALKQNKKRLLKNMERG